MIHHWFSISYELSELKYEKNHRKKEDIVLIIGILQLAQSYVNLCFCINKQYEISLLITCSDLHLFTLKTEERFSFTRMA